MGRIRVTSGTDFAVRFLLGILGLILLSVIAVIIEPAIHFVLLGNVDDMSAATFIVAFFVLLVILSIIPGDPDEHMAAISTFVYVLEVHKIFLTWRDAKACSNLFANNSYDTWYPLTDIAKLPRAQRKIAILSVAKKTGRIIESHGTDERAKEIAKKTLILTAACLAWGLFVAYGAARVSYTFDVNGFVEMGAIPAIATWIGFWIWFAGYKK